MFEKKLLKNKIRGVGMGLTICSLISTALCNEGRLEIESEKEKGTTLSFFIED